MATLPVAPLMPWTELTAHGAFLQTEPGMPTVLAPEKVSQIDAPRPSSLYAPSIWYDAVPSIHVKFFG